MEVMSDDEDWGSLCLSAPLAAPVACSGLQEVGD